MKYMQRTFLFSRTLAYDDLNRKSKINTIRSVYSTQISI